MRHPYPSRRDLVGRAVLGGSRGSAGEGKHPCSPVTGPLLPCAPYPYEHRSRADLARDYHSQIKPLPGPPSQCRKAADNE